MATTNCGRRVPTTFVAIRLPTSLIRGMQSFSTTPTSTRAPFPHHHRTSPWFLQISRWNAITSLNSDHLPFCISFDGDSPPRTSRSFTNLRKANWADFEQRSEDHFARTPLPASCSTGKKVWRRIIQRSSARSIPCGFRSDFCPGIDADSARLMKEG